MKHKLFYLLIFVCLVSINFVSSSSDLTFKQDEFVNFSFVCLDTELNYCNSSTTCLISIIAPNGTAPISNESLNFSPTSFNFIFPTVDLGTHDWLVICQGLNSARSEGDYMITTSGSSITEGNSLTLSLAVIFFMIISILLFINFIRVTEKAQIKWTSFLLGFIFMLAALNLISLILLDSIVSPGITSFIDFFIASSFYMYWLAFGLLAVVWIFTIINTVLFKQKIKNEQMFNPI